MKLIDCVKADKECRLISGKRPKRKSKNTWTRADLLRLVILCKASDLLQNTTKIWQDGAYVVGDLDRERETIMRDINCLNCRFNAPFMLRAASCCIVNLQGSHIPGLNAQDLKTGSDIF